MADWEREIEIELLRAKESSNPGRTRTAARRIAGIAIQELQKRGPGAAVQRDYISALRVFAKSEKPPEKVAAAAARLEARLSADFISPSTDPVGDAMIIVDFVRTKLHDSGEKDIGK
ncbi:MAG: hypothetical protein WBZ48_12760 [Bacteroidota bacterium]